MTAMELIAKIKAGQQRVYFKVGTTLYPVTEITEETPFSTHDEKVVVLHSK